MVFYCAMVSFSKKNFWIGLVRIIVLIIFMSMIMFLFNYSLKYSLRENKPAIENSSGFLFFYIKFRAS